MIKVSIDQLFSSWVKYIVILSRHPRFISFPLLFFLIDRSCVFGLYVFLTIGYVLPNVDACIFLKRQSLTLSSVDRCFDLFYFSFTVLGALTSIKLRLIALSEPFG